MKASSGNCKFVKSLLSEKTLTLVLRFSCRNSVGNIKHSKSQNCKLKTCVKIKTKEISLLIIRLNKSISWFGVDFFTVTLCTANSPALNTDTDQESKNSFSGM